MKIPNQVIPESQKTKVHIDKTIKAIVHNCKTQSQNKDKDYESWLLYNERFYEKEFDYLRKIGDYTLPAKFRWIGVQRPRINLLESQQSKRPFVFSVRVGDKESRQHKIQNKVRYFIAKHQVAVEQKKVMLQRQIMQLEMQVSMLEQALQQEPETEEEAMQLQQIQQALPEIKLVISHSVERLKSEEVFTEKELKEIDTYLRMNYKEMKEHYAEVLMRKMILKKNIKNKLTAGFRAKCVTGKPYFYVDYRHGEVLPDFEVLDDISVYFPSINNVEKVQDGPWVVIEQGWSTQNIISIKDNNLTAEDIKKLEDDEQYFHDSYLEGPSETEATLSMSNSYAGTNPTNYRWKVFRVWFKSPRKVYIKYSPNPYEEGKYFRKILSEEEAGKVGTKNKDVVRTDKGDKLEVRYVTDIYEGIYVNYLDKVIYSGKKEYVRSYVDDYRKKDLPVYGPTFSSMTRQPYSLIRATEDLQKLINILHYHRELLLAVAGTKVTVVDKSQIPSGMSAEEHQYHKKTGNLYIQTVSKGGRKINSSFNQWQVLDETISPAIQYIDAMIRSTDDMIGYIMGIGPQRMGQVVQGDQVGKTEMAIQQNALVTEILYYEYDSIAKDALEAALNLATKYCFFSGGIISDYNQTQGEQDIIIPAKLWDNVDLEIHLENNTEEETAMVTMKQIMLNEYMQGRLPLEAVVSTYRVNTLKELEKKYEILSEKAQKIAQESQEGMVRAKSEAEQQKIQFEQEFKKVMKEQEIQLEVAKLQIDEAKLQFDREKAALEAELKEKEIKAKMSMEIYKVDSDRDVELQYLQEQQRQAVTDEKLREIALKVDIMFKKMQITQQDIDSARKSQVENKKVTLQERQKGVQNKKKIKD